MTLQVFKCRFVKPGQSEWFEITADTYAVAANELHDRHVPNFKAEPGCQSIVFWFTAEKPGNSVAFACIEVEGHGEFVSRIYHSGIVRRGGVKLPGRELTIVDVAKAVGWTKDPAELLTSGWEAEEEEWK